MTACTILLFSSLLAVGYISFSRAEESLLGDGPRKQRRLDENPFVYSKMSVLDPDPLLVEDEAEREALREKYGHWHFWDGSEGGRPTTDYCGEYKYRDIPVDDYPDGAWQKDAVFINHILDEAGKMVARAIEAIFSDYGRGKPLPPEEFKQRAEMFQMLKLDLTTQTSAPEDYQADSGQRLKGGWTTERSYKGLVRRLLHAMNTNDEFVVVLGGDAAAAGHGNHFRQAYLMQFHRIFSPIMARMGVKLITRNMAMGHGLGTVQSSLGFTSLFGHDIDVLIWDGAMTESDAKYVDFFFRQGLLSSGKQGKIPYLMIGGNSNPHGLFDLMRWFHNEAGADVGQLGTGLYGVPFTESEEQAQNLTHAFRYLRCKPSEERLCNQQKYCTRCWLNRTDVVNPEELFPQLETDQPQGQTSAAASRWWYPGWRQHQLLGRTLAYTLLDALLDAVEQWMSGSFSGPPLAGEKWHVTEMYDNMRTQVNTALSSPSQGTLCYELANETLLPERICRISMKGATHHTPRLNGTSIAELVVTDDATLIPSNPKSVLYDGQDVHNECMDSGNVDVAQVLNLRRRRQRKLSYGVGDDDSEWEDISSLFREIQDSRTLAQEKDVVQSKQRSLEDDGGDKNETITLGKGWSIHGEKPGACNGEYLSICGRDSSDSCPLLGYHDSGGAIAGLDSCGWLVLDIPRVEHGILILKYAFYDVDQGHTHQQNEQSNLRARRLNSAIPDNENFRFEFAIDGQVTSWNREELSARTKTVHRRMDTITLMDNPEFTEEAKTVQLSIRIKESGKSCVLALSHVYWA